MINPQEQELVRLFRLLNDKDREHILEQIREWISFYHQLRRPGL